MNHRIIHNLNLNRMKIMMLIISMLWSFYGYSQNYRLINKDKSLTYTKRNLVEVDSAYFFMKVDSVAASGMDSIYYFNHTLDTIGFGPCEALNGDTTMLGDKMIIKSDTDATHIFFNKYGDSIFIKSLVNIGDVWHIYEWSNGTYVKATVINKLWLTILPGIQDSVTRIQLNVFTAGGTMLTDTFPNQTKWDITKNHGIIEFFDFHNFPEPVDSIQLLLRGLANPDINVVDVDAETAFNYEPGYEFHYREEISPDDGSDAEKRISAWKYFVMSKTQGANSVTYQMERIRFDTLFFDDNPSSSITWDTVDVTYLYEDYQFLDTLELNLFQANKFGYSDWIQNDSIYKGIPHKYVYDWYDYDIGSGCLSNPDNISQPEQLYGDGLGLMHYKDSSGVSDYYKFDMVYFQVGLLVWGTPYDFSDLDVPITDLIKNEIFIHPNPANDVLIIDHNSDLVNCIISVYNLNGQLVKQFEQHAAMNEIQIPVSELTAGFYLLEIIDSNESFRATFIKN